MKTFLKCNGGFARFLPSLGAATLILATLCLAASCRTGGYSEITSAENADPQKANSPRAIPTSGDGGPQAAQEVSLQADTCRPGSTFRTITGDAASPDACREICRNLIDCMAFTYLAPAGEGARCELKHSVPDAVADSTAAPQQCVSWVNPRASAQLAALEAQGFEMRSARPGDNFREFEMNQPDPALCKEACENLRDCAAFTYTRPGYDGEQARCALTTAVNPQVSDQDCCISGTK